MMHSFLKCKTSFLSALCLLSVLTNAQTIKPTPSTERLKGMQARKQQVERSLLNSVPFRNIGPTQMNGRVVDIEVNPADPTEFYVAYASGGLWYTHTNGLSFEPLFQQEDAMTIGDIAVHWPSRTIWIGTGESNSSRSSYSGIGVYRSADAGKTWQYSGLSESHHIGKIIVHPTQPETVWVAVMGHLYSPNPERGVYKTTDGGKNWKQTLFVNENTGAIEMDINPKNPDELYACMWYRTRRAWDFEPTGASSGIYKSADGGNSWKLISGEGSGFPSGPKMGRSGISIFAGNPEIVYAVVDNNSIKPDTARRKTDTSKYVLSDFKDMVRDRLLDMNNAKIDSFLKKNRFPKKYSAQNIKERVVAGQLPASAIYDWLIADDGFQNNGIHGCEIYRSENGGKTWRKVNEELLDVYSSYGYYFGKLFVSPVNDQKVISFGTSIILSEDGGKHFTAVDKNNTHGDWHTCWINPNRDAHWIAGNDGGCNITYDNGKKWFKATSVPAGQFYHITTDDAQPYRVYGGLQDNGIWVGASRLSDDDLGFSFAEEKKIPDPEDYAWKPIGGGDGMQVQVDLRDNNTVYSGSQFGYYSRSQVSNPDEGISIHPMHDLGESKLRYNWQTPILLSRHQPDILYYGANRLFRSFNKGADMQVLSPDLTNGKKKGLIPYGTITTLTESPARFGLIYIGTDDGNIHISKDGGYTYSSVNIERSLKQIPAGLWVSKLVASKYAEGRLYACLNGYRYDHFTAYLFVSNDYGSTWQQLGLSLPPEPLNTVKEDPFLEDILYAGTDNGLYASFDRGIQFMPFAGDFPRVSVHELVIQERDKELVVGTHGRSIFIASLDTVHTIYKKWKSAADRLSGLGTFDPEQMTAGASSLDCPPAASTRKKKKKG